MIDDELAAGAQTLDWNARDEAGRELASGVYFARLVTSPDERTIRMVLLR